VIVPRLCSDLLGDGLLIEGENWGDTAVQLPQQLSKFEFKGLFSTQAVTLDKDLRISTALKSFPVNLYLQSDS